MARVDPETGKLILSLCEYLELEEEEILGCDNMYYAAQALGHEPSKNEAALHYIEHGGAKVFAEKYILEGRICPKKESSSTEEKNNPQ